MTPSIVAAGGVVWRRDIEGEIEVLLVHRPRYDDWSLPKGKQEEVEALIGFLSRHPLHFIQWRNLNFDPLRYLKEMNAAATHSRPIGMKAVLELVQERFPDISHGYFNPPKERFYVSFLNVVESENFVCK